MAWKTYFGFLIILLLKEAVTEDPCKESNDAVAACKTVVDVRRQLFIPINNTIGDGCQCTVKLVSITENQFTDKVETKFLNNECGFNASTELNGVLETLTCDNPLVTKDMETGEEMIYRFTGKSDSDATVCLQIVPEDSDSKVNIICADQITDPNIASTTVAPPTTSSSTSSPTSRSTSSPTSTTPATQSPSTPPTTAQTVSSTGLPPNIPGGSLFHTSSEPNHQTTNLAPDDTGKNVPKSTTIKPKEDKPDITFIIILVGSCVGGFLIILLIILITWCIIYRRRKKRYEAKEALPNNEADQHSLEGIQVENELFILAYQADEGREDRKQSDAIYESPQEYALNPDNQLPDIVKPSGNGVKKVNFDIRNPIEELPEESVTEFKTDTILMNDTTVNPMSGRIQL